MDIVMFLTYMLFRDPVDAATSNMLAELINAVFSKMLSILYSILPTNNNIRPNREQRRTLFNELWERDAPHVMIVRYNDEDERIGTQATITTFHINPIHAIYAFFNLLGLRDQRHPVLNNNMYYWMVAHLDGLGDPTAMDLVDNVMADLTEYNTVIHHSGIIALEIIPLLEYYGRDNATLAERPEGTTNLELVSMSDDAFAPGNYPPTPDLPTPDLPTPNSPTPNSPSPNPEPLMDLDGDVIMFDHSVPPSELNPPFLGDGSKAHLSEITPSSPLHPDSPLFATPTLGPVPLPSTNNPHAPLPDAAAHNTRACSVRNPRRRIVEPNLNARRIHACAFAGCPSRFTRSSDLARHWRSVHAGHARG